MIKLSTIPCKIRLWLYPRLYKTPLHRWLYTYPVLHISGQGQYVKYNCTVLEVGMGGLHINPVVDMLTAVCDKPLTFVEDWHIEYRKLTGKGGVYVSQGGVLRECGDADLPL